MDIDMVKSRGKKKYFQGIHDRFIRDPEFRNRMIENNRDEELCRKWDALADEDHTHHLTPQEYSLYKNKWWPHSNKQGSNTMQTTHRSDFKKGIVYLAAIKTKKKTELYKRPRTLAEINNGHKVLLHGGIGKVHGGLLISMKVTMEMNQVLTERCDLLYSIWNNSSGQDFLENNYFVTDGSFAADGCLLQPTGCVSTTPQMTCFRGAKVCRKWLQGKVTIKLYSLTTN